mmetsp:Transcript_32237/g.54340  ORF Transcript_32237/g.54340 Transcript_32237/m.54340 type:complete len:286 (-) Transcript_32237:468-1325(-)
MKYPEDTVHGKRKLKIKSESSASVPHRFAFSRISSSIRFRTYQIRFGGNVGTPWMIEDGEGVAACWAKGSKPGDGTGKRMPAVSVTQNANTAIRIHQSIDLLASSWVVATGVTSSTGGMSAPLCNKTTARSQYKVRGEELVRRLTAWPSNVAVVTPFALCRPATAMAIRPPSNRPIGMKFKALERRPPTPTASSGCTGIFAVASEMSEMCKNLSTSSLIKNENLKKPLGNCGYVLRSSALAVVVKLSPCRVHQSDTQNPKNGPAIETSNSSLRVLGNDRNRVTDP